MVTRRPSCGQPGMGVLIHLILDEPICPVCREAYYAALERPR